MKLLLVPLLLLSSFACVAAQKAVTEDGRIVILQENQTWSYEAQDAAAPKIVDNTKAKFSKKSSQVFQIKSQKNNAALWIDPVKWGFRKENKPGSPMEFSLKHKSLDIYATIITEQIELSFDSLMMAALKNAQAAAPDASIALAEYRIVNGVKVLKLRMNGKVNGIDFSYVGYYVANKNGCTQYVAFTSQNLAERYMAEIEEFLDGVSAQDGL